MDASVWRARAGRAQAWMIERARRARTWWIIGGVAALAVVAIVGATLLTPPVQEVATGSASSRGSSPSEVQAPNRADPSKSRESRSSSGGPMLSPTLKPSPNPTLRPDTRATAPPLPKSDPAPPASADPAPPGPADPAQPVPAQPVPAQPEPPAPAQPAPADPAPVVPAPVDSSDAGMAAEVVRLVNNERAAVGCGAVGQSSLLDGIARQHSQDMADNAYFSHNSQDGRTPFDRLTAGGYSYSAAGENIAAGQSSAESVMAAWMNSEGHRDNILNCAYTSIGIGIGHGGPSGTYWTQVFGAE